MAGSSLRISAELLEFIYDAASHPARWSDTLVAIARWVGAEVGTIAARRLSAVPETVRITNGIDPRYHRAQIAYRKGHEPHAIHVASLPVGRAFSLSELLANTPHEAASYVLEGLRSVKQRHLQGLIVHRDADWQISLATLRSTERDFDVRSRARLELVAAHIGRALKDRLDARADLPVLDLAQRMGLVGVAQLDRGGQILEGGDLLEQLASGECVVRMVRRKQLRAVNAKDQKQLTRSLTHAIRGKASMLVLGKGENALSLGVAPGPFRSPLSADRSASVVFALRRHSPAQVASARYAALPGALSPVAELLSRGLSDKEIASRLSLSMPTTRTYVTRVLKRLELSNRRQLMASPQPELTPSRSRDT